MDQGPLVTEETDAGEELVRRLDKYIPVNAAFWVKDSEEGQWFLYIASDQIDDTNLAAAYGDVLRLAAQIGSPYLDPFRVKLVPTSDPLAQAAIDIHRRFPGRIASRLGGSNFGGLSVDGVFIYPAIETTITP
jgi:hypothetical protein